MLGVVYAHPDVKVDDPVVQKVDAYVTRMLKAALPGSSRICITFAGIDIVARQLSCRYLPTHDLLAILASEVEKGRLRMV